MDLKDLRQQARNYIETITASNPTPTGPQFLIPPDGQAPSIAALVEHLGLSHSEHDKLQIFEDLVILETCLSQISDLGRDSQEQSAAIFLREWVANAILPSEAFAERPLYSAEARSELNPEDVAKARAMGLKGLVLLSHLRRLVTPLQDGADTAVLTCLAAFSDEKDPWNSSSAQQQASDLVKDYTRSDHLPAMLTSILQDRIKPLFSRTGNPTITPQGRKAINPRPSNFTMHTDIDAEVKPWKFRDVYIVTVFRWVLQYLDESSVQANWPLIAPPLLALLDDSSLKYKIKGCNTLSILLERCPSALLERTGLGEVFEDAVMPCLNYLPTLTEEAESLRILGAAYPVLIQLALVRFPDDKKHAAKIKALDRVLRNGIVKGYAHAGEHVKIAELFVHQITRLVNETGIDFVRHLKYILPLLSANLASPFATAYPPLLQASVISIQAIMVNLWPRMAYHKGEIMRGLLICWCRIKDCEVESRELLQIQQGIEDAMRLLKAVVQSDVDVGEDYRILVDSDPRLRDLLVA